MVLFYAAFGAPCQGVVSFPVSTLRWQRGELSQIYPSSSECFPTDCHDRPSGVKVCVLLPCPLLQLKPQQSPRLSAGHVPERAGATAQNPLRGKRVPVFVTATRLSPPHLIIQRDAEECCQWKNLALQEK